MQRQQTKQCEVWRRRREQYLRESGRHVELIKEGYASADSTYWTVISVSRAHNRPAETDFRNWLARSPSARRAW